jgi:hypothetical protein
MLNFAKIKDFWGRMQQGCHDGIFSNQKSQFRYILEVLKMEDFGIFYGHLVILWPFGIF